MDNQQRKIYARKGLVFSHNQERDRVEGKRTGQERGHAQADKIIDLSEAIGSFRS